MDESEREALLDRIQRQGATIGARTPDTITVGGDEIDLQEFLIETRRVDGLTESERKLVLAAERELTAERERLVEQLEHDDIDLSEAERLAETIVGLDRALNALSSVRGHGFGQLSRTETVNDHRRWIDFLESITG